MESEQDVTCPEHHVRCKNNDPTNDWSDFQIEIVTVTAVLWVLSHPVFDWGKACFTPVVLYPISYKHTYCKVYGYDQIVFVCKEMKRHLQIT